MPNIGTDIVDVNRIRLACEKYAQRFKDRVFTDKEQEYCEKSVNKYERYAGRFAAKEAFMKATKLNNGSISFSDIEIIKKESGAVEIQLSPELSKRYSDEISVSISHTKDYATAVVLWQDQ